MSGVSPAEAELDRLLQWLPDHSRRTVVTGIFRQAIALHRAADVQGYLGAPPSSPRDVSIMLKHLFLCAVYGGKDFYLMIDNVPGVQETGTWRGFECDPSRATQGELASIHCNLDEQRVLEAILTDGDVWLAYKRTLQRIEAVNRSDRPATLQRVSVLA